MNIHEAFEILEPYRWTKPDSYYGIQPTDCFVIATRNRESSVLEESNWKSFCKLLEEAGANIARDDVDGMVWDFRASHWAVGWVEYLMLNEGAPDHLLILAAETLAALDDYPIISEDDYSTDQYEAVLQYWEDCSLRERISYCKDVGESIFSARPNQRIPERVYDRLNDEIY